MLKRGNLIGVAVILFITILPPIIIFLEDYQTSSPYIENNNATFSGNIEREGDSRFHSIRISENVTRIHCILQCGGVDFDLYGRFGEIPSLDDYDFIGYTGEGENLYYDYPIPGILQLMVHSYSGTGHYDLTVKFEYNEVM